MATTEDERTREQRIEALEARVTDLERSIAEAHEQAQAAMSKLPRPVRKMLGFEE